MKNRIEIRRRDPPLSSLCLTDDGVRFYLHLCSRSICQSKVNGRSRQHDLIILVYYFHRHHSTTMVRFQPAFLISIAASFWSSTNVFALDVEATTTNTFPRVLTHPLTVVESSTTDWIYGDPWVNCQASCEHVDGSDTCNASARESIQSNEHLVYVASLVGVTCPTILQGNHAISPSKKDETCYWNSVAGVSDCETEFPSPPISPFCCCGSNCPVVEPTTTAPTSTPTSTPTSVSTLQCRVFFLFLFLFLTLALFLSVYL